MAEQDELHAAIEARKELGPDYEPQVVDSFLERIEKRLEQRQDSHLEIHPHPSVTPLALGSIGAGVGATAVATGMGNGRDRRRNHRLDRDRDRQRRLRAETPLTSASAAAGSASRIPAKITAQPPHPSAPSLSPASV
jgi:hypothetical protein